jgi:hypothetical protein
MHRLKLAFALWRICWELPVIGMHRLLEVAIFVFPGCDYFSENDLYVFFGNLQKDSFLLSAKKVKQ